MHLCPSCSRHIREAVCPFCKTESEPSAPPAEGASWVGLKRSALLATVLAATGCAPAAMAAYGIPVDSAAPTDAAETSIAPAYGIAVDAAPPPDATPEGSVAPPYGVPPNDAGNG